MQSPPWLTQLLLAPEVTDICLNGPNEIFIDRGHGMEPAPLHADWNEESMRLWVLELLSNAGKTWDARHPFVDATLGSGHRLHVSFPPIARKGILVSLRRIPQASDREQGALRWTRNAQGAFFYPKLAEIIRSGDSLLISGATGSGKSTLANDLLGEVPSAERMIALEDTPELAPCHPHFLSLVSRPSNADGCGEVTLRMLLRQTLRMRPDRIILGECRGAEVLELLQALNTGHRGALATLHANTAREALKRIELLCLLGANGALSLSAIRELLALGIQWLVHVRRTPDAGREIAELWRVEGREGDTILLRPVIKPS